MRAGGRAARGGLESSRKGEAMSESFFQVGKSYIIRTVTMIQVGRLVGVNEQEVLLEDASWIAETDRYHDTLSNGTFREVEPFTAPVIVGRGAIVDAQEWAHPLPKTQK